MFEKEEEEHQGPTSSPSGTRKQQQQHQQSSVKGSKAMMDVNKSSSSSPSQTTSPSRRYGKPPKRVSTSGDTSTARMGGVMMSHQSHANNSNNNNSSRNDSVLRTVSMDGSNAALMNQQTPQSTFDTKKKNSVDGSNNNKNDEEANPVPGKVSRTNGLLVLTSTKATTQEQEEKKLQQTATPTFSFATSSHAKQHVTTKKKKIVPLTLSPNAHHLTQNASFLRRYNNFNKSSSPSSTGVGSVNDGIREVASHTILNGALGYAKLLYPQHNLSVRDLMVGMDAWRLKEVNTKDKNKEELLPKKLTEKAGYTKLLERSCVLYLSPGGRDLPLQQALSGGEDDEDEESDNKIVDGWDRGDWNALAKLTFLYCAKDSFSIVEHRKKIIKDAKDQATNQNSTDSSSWLYRYDDSNLILYQFETQYKSLPRSSSSSSSVSSKVTNEFDLAEEIAMTTFGGSIDDGLKFGAISSLHDLAGKYVMEIESVRGKIYRYDLIKEEEEKEEIVNGENEEQQRQQQQKQGGLLFQGAGGRRRSSGSVNALLLGTTDQLRVSVSSVNDNVSGAGSTAISYFNRRKDVTKMRLTLATDDKEDNDGKMLLGDNNEAGGEQEKGANKPQQHEKQHCQHILKQFRTLRPHISAATAAAMSTTSSSLLLPNSVNSIAIGTPSNHILLLHHTESSNIYVNGQYVMNWGNDTQNCASHHVALFGYDLFDSNTLEGGGGVIENYDTMKMEISRLIQEVLIDASQRDKDFCGRLLRRLIHGYDINEDSSVMATTPTENNNPKKWKSTLQLPSSVHRPCLESELMSNSKYDPVGISAKALATCFAQRYGQNAYPCLSCDVTYVTDKLGPHKVPIVVPQRTIDVLRRGGYFDIRRTEMEMVWFVEGGMNLRPEFRQEEEKRTAARKKQESYNDNGSSGSLGTTATVQEKSSADTSSSPSGTIIREAIDFLQNANITDVDVDNIVLVRNESLIPSTSTHDPVKGKFMCRYHPTKNIYYVNDAILNMPVDDDTSATQKCSISSNGKDNSSGEEEMTTRTMGNNNKNIAEDGNNLSNDDDMITIRRRKKRSYMLGLYVAQEHPDGNVLVRYVLGNQQLSHM